MDLVQQLLQIFHVYQDNSELIAAAVKDLHRVGDNGLTTLKRGLEERKRKHILKAVALLAPSDIPAKVVEVDGVDDAELAVCGSHGWIKTAFAIYLRHDDLSNALSSACSSTLGDAVGFYAHSVLAAVWDHVELGDERLADVEKPVVYQSSKSEAASYKILAFEAARDGLRRFTVLSAVLMEPHTGQVLITQRAKVLTLASFTLDPSKMTGLEFCVAGLGFAEHQNEAWNALNVVCSMFAEVRDQPEGVRLIETILSYMAEALVIARNQVLEAWKDDPPMTWIPSRKDLKDIHNRNEEAARNRVRRQFTVRDTIFTTVKDAHSSGQQSSVLGKSFVLECMADRQIYDLGRKLVDLYQEQKILPLQLRETGNSSAFATYIYSSLGRPVVAEEYRNIFSSGKVNIRQSKSGTLIFVPHSCIVTMTTHGMVCKSIKVENSQVFEYNSADRFALLPHLISILGLREDDALLSALVTEMDENAYLVADPMTFDIRACMTRSLETSRRVFRVSALHEDARKFVGNDHYQGLVREAVSLLARLGATVPPEYVGRSCFYDITRDLKGYRDQSTQMQILFDRGVVLDGLGCQILVNESHILGKLNIAVDGGHVITHLVKNNLRKHRPTPEENNEEFKAMRAAVEAAGLVMMSAAFDIYGEVRLAVTRSDPGNGMFAIFDGCEAR